MSSDETSTGASNVVRGAFGGKKRTPWQKGRGIDSVLKAWESQGFYRNITLNETLAARPSQSGPIPESLGEAPRRALAARGITELYSHQIQAVELARQKRDFVVATPTASGKSLCYNLPVLQELSENPDARALYLFPTKALSRDQEEALKKLFRDGGLDRGCITFDGDTPGDARRSARERASVILTNPDMLHAGVLPHHAGWARLFANLRYVVLDELHTYRGVFGSHLANVVRRLLRIARFHGSDPTFVFASATIGNPGEHASKMLGREVAVIDESGAPTGERQVMVFNPPVINPELGLRASYLKSAVRVATDLVRADVPTLVFGQSRNGVEVMLKYLRDRLRADHVPSDAIHAYRGGYLPKQRRRIEQQLRDGEIKCVVATNALELGIDIGSLDAVVLAGYPGTLAGTWQRFGRAGRRSGRALNVLVTSSMPLDQYLAANARQLMSDAIEWARIDPDNVEILVQHLKCAAFELPFEEKDHFGDLEIEHLRDALGFLADNGVVHPAPDASGQLVYHWATDSYPANHVSLRSLSWDNFVIVDLDTDKNFAEMDWRSTHTMLHEQAIYQHAGQQYQVERLDFENHKAFVRKVKPDYYTTAMTHTKVTVMEESDSEPLRLDEIVTAGWGEVSVVQKVVGYKKIKFHTHENVGYGDVRLPEMQKHTTAFWITVPEVTVEKFMSQMALPRAQVVDVLRGLLHAMHTIAATGLMMDPRDIGQVVGDHADPFAPDPDEASAPQTPPQQPAGHFGTGNAGGFDPTLFLYDQVAGGIGLAERLYDQRDELLRRTRSLLDGCGCRYGCPACVGAISSPDDLKNLGAGADLRGQARAFLDMVGVPAIH